MANPFEKVVFSGDLTRETTYRPLYKPALNHLLRSLDSSRETEGHGQTSRLVLVSPAGGGKSHFLARLAGEPGLPNPVLNLRVDPVSFRWEDLFRQALDWLHEETGGGMTRLEKLSRQMFAGITADLIRSEALPCPYPSRVLPWLRENNQRLFYLDETDLVENWIHEHFESAGPRALIMLGPELDLEPVPIRDWLRLLLEYNRIPTRIANREQARSHQKEWLRRLPAVKDSGARNHFTTLFRLLTRVHPVVMAFDSLDQFHGRRSPLFSFVCLLEQLREAAPRCFQVISVSKDVWHSAFEGGVPKALIDRLNLNRIDLGGLASSESKEFLREFLRETGWQKETREAFLESGPWSTIPDDEQVLPRTLLCQASAHWDQFDPDPPSSDTGPDDWKDAFLNVGDLISGRRPPSNGRTGGMNGRAGLVGASCSTAAFPEGLQGVLLRLKQRGAKERDYLPKWPEENEPDDGEQLPLPLKGEESTNEQRSRSRPPELFLDQGRLRSRYERLVSKLAEGPRPEKIEWPTLKALVQIAGEKFPIVDQETVEVLGAPGCYAVRWRTEAGEIWMGFEPYSNVAYWRALSGFLKNHAMVVWEKDQFRAKLMVFLHENNPDGFHKVWNANRQQFSSAPYVDIVHLDREHLGRLYAVEQLLHEGSIYDEVPGKPGVLSQLVSELDFFLAAFDEADGSGAIGLVVGH